CANVRPPSGRGRRSRLHYPGAIGARPVHGKGISHPIESVTTNHDPLSARLRGRRASRKRSIMPQELARSGARRFIRSLPANPNLDKQRKLAKALARAYWRGESEAVERVRALHPQPPAPENFSLSDAQLVIARGYGFAGWPHMKQKIESLTKSPAELFKAAVEAGDVDPVRGPLPSHPHLVPQINEPVFRFPNAGLHWARPQLPLPPLPLCPTAPPTA